MFEIILMVYLSYRNSVRAKLKGLSPMLWGSVTAAAFLGALIFGGLIVIFNFCGDIINRAQLGSMDPQARNQASQQLYQALSANPLHLLTIELFGIGGYWLAFKVFQIDIEMVSAMLGPFFILRNTQGQHSYLQGKLQGCHSVCRKRDNVYSSPETLIPGGMAGFLQSYRQMLSPKTYRFCAFREERF